MKVCAVDIGGSFTKLGLIDSAGGVHHFRRMPTVSPAEAFLAELFRQIETLLALETVTGIGVSVAGFLDAARSCMIYNPNLPWLENLPIRALLSGRFAMAVTVEVDSNAGALGEFVFGAGAGARRFLCLTIGTGIGGGLLIDGEIVRIMGECAGDVGHVIVAPGGLLCSCGGRGCAEAVAAGPAVIETGRFDEAGAYIGLLASSLGAIFFPDRIALGGGIVEASPDVVRSAQRAFTQSAGSHVRGMSEIVRARLGAHAPLVGAACPLLPFGSR